MANNTARGTSLEDMAKRIYNKEEVSDDELRLAVALDMNTFLSEMTISASETRQVRQYESNNYFLSMQYNLEQVRQMFMLELNGDPMEKIAKYLDMKKTTIKFLADKYSLTENLLRELIAKQKVEDGVKT